MNGQTERTEAISDARGVLDMAISEKEFQDVTIAFARRKGWMVYHPFDSRRSVAGYPDLVCCRDRIVFVELKTMRGRLSEAQRTWIAAIAAAGGEIYVWRPSDFEEIVRILT